ncbi:MAG: thymidine phosphorylase [Bacillota bacterium]
MYDIILKKREGMELTRAEIEYWVNGYVKNTIVDYQVASLLMAIYFNGLSDKETIYLTQAMINSGEQVNLNHLPGIKADKHSTGGVGDKTTLVLAPLIAAAGIKVAKMSGRGLGHTGGTLDKLESIPGFQTELSPVQFMENLQKVGLAITGQTSNLVPADKKLYALRNVTATVDSIPLIASSVMSKKIAAGSEIIVLDVKYGSGAFIKSPQNAQKLAKTMVEIGTGMKRKVAAVISSMDCPLGFAVGNALEVKEAINTLTGKGPDDLKELCLVLAGLIFVLAGYSPDLISGKKKAKHILNSGEAAKKFAQFIKSQGGDSGIIDNTDLLPEARFRCSIIAPKNGYITKMNSESIGRASTILGAGRINKEDTIDPSVGIVFHKKTGDPVIKNETIAMIHTNDEDKIDEALNMLKNSIWIENTPSLQVPLIYGVLTENGFDTINT